MLGFLGKKTIANTSRSELQKPVTLVERHRLAIDVLHNSLSLMESREWLSYSDTVEYLLDDMNRAHIGGSFNIDLPQKSIKKYRECILPVAELLTSEHLGVCSQAATLIGKFVPPQVWPAMLSLLTALNNMEPKRKLYSTGREYRVALTEALQYFANMPRSEAESEVLRVRLLLGDLRTQISGGSDMLVGQEDEDEEGADDSDAPEEYHYLHEYTGTHLLACVDWVLLVYAERYCSPAVIKKLLVPLWGPTFQEERLVHLLVSTEKGDDPEWLAMFSQVERNYIKRLRCRSAS